MQVTLEKTGELSRAITVTVPADEVSKKVNERLQALGRSVKIAGFRPGKVPMQVLQQRFGGKIGGEVSEDIVSATMPQAFEQEKVSPVGRPDVDFPLAVDGEPFKYTIKFDIMPDIKPAGVKGLSLTRHTADVADADIKDALDRLAQRYRTFAKKDGKSAKGDQVVITAQGVDAKSGAELDGAKVTMHPVELGSGALIPGFEDQLEGHKAGEEFAIEVTFPKDYHAKHLAGVKAKFNVTLHEVNAVKPATVDDELAKKFGLADLAEFKTKVSEQLKGDIDNASRQRLKRDLFDTLEKTNTFPLPAGMVEVEFNAIWRNLLNDMARSETTFDMLDKSEDEMRAEHRKLAERRVRLGLLLSEIGKENNIKVDGKEIEAEIKRMSQGQPAEVAGRIDAYFRSDRGRNEIVGPLYENKVCDWIFENAKITDKKVKAEELLEEFAG